MRSILPGRPQSTRQALCTVNWDGLRLVAYISGNTVVVFNGRREILQSISVDDTDVLSSLIIHEASGQIAVSDKSTVYVYQPFGRDYGDLRWTRTQTLPHETEDLINYLSWGSEDELLVAGSRLTLWNLTDERRPQVIWASHLSSPVSIACFSPDAGLIASCGQHDRLVKIWRRLSYEQDSTRFDVSYLPHSSVITKVSWRSFWHQEQNIDNVLYTFGTDNHIHVWAHSEQHAYNIMQRIATIDTSTSIQPRRMSIGSVSKNRFAFLLESRDLARAAERSLQMYRTGTDHALENFIQIVSRSPEICVILDGLGHMSAWGIENAGLRNKQDPEKFNAALVDGVNIPLPSGRNLDDHVQIHAFANNDVSASLCILVHLYSGQVDWYQGSFIEFFDTAARTHRTQLMSCWSGHDSALENMVSSDNNQSFISLDEQEHAIVWSRSETGALVRKSRMQSDAAILDATLLGERELAIFLHEDKLSLWDVRNVIARRIGGCEIGEGEPVSLSQAGVMTKIAYGFEVAVLFDNGRIERYGIIRHNNLASQTNGDHRPVTRLGTNEILDLDADDTVVFCRASHLSPRYCEVLSLSDAGEVRIFGVQQSDRERSTKPRPTLRTNIRASNIVTSFNGRRHAFAHADYKTISIWNTIQTTCEYVGNFDDLDSIQELYWHSPSEGQLLLAVQFPYNIVILAQRRYTSRERFSSWELLQTIRTRDYITTHVNSLCWLQPCQLVLGVGSQIRSFDLNRDPSTFASNQDESRTNAASSIQEYLRLENASLPIFDPDLLNQLLLSSQAATVATILQALHESLRFLVQGEEVDHNLKLSLYIESEVTALMPNGATDQTKMQAQDRFADVADLYSQLEQNIPKIAETQLSLHQQRRLQLLTQIYRQLHDNQGSMDSHALKYLYHFLSAMSNLDPTVLELPSLPFSAIAHASLSRTQESLTHFILSQLERQNVKFTWQNARALGIFLFTSDIETLRVHLESVAKAEYNRNPDDRNPVDCSLYYLALDKKAILQLLWRRAVGIREKENTIKLLSRDFKDPKAKSTALKNAYALLSKRRFEYAAAFFLLGGNLADAVNVCVNQMRDIQLAIAITRAWNGESSMQDQVMKNLVERDLLDVAINTHEARWLGVWGCVYREDYLGAILYITGCIDQLFEAQFRSRRSVERNEKTKADTPFPAHDPRVNEPGPLISVYLWLRTKMIDRQRWTRETASVVNEWRFVIRCADWYVRAGMDVLALRLVSTWQFVALQQLEDVDEVRKTHAEAVAESEEKPKSALDEWLIEDEEVNLVKSKSDREDAIINGQEEKAKKKPPPTQFIEPSADSLLDSFGF